MYSNYQTRIPARVGLKWNRHWPLFEVPRDILEFYRILRLKISSMDSETLDQPGFYMLLTENPFNEHRIGNLLYIGQAYDQTLRGRIPQQHPAYDCIVQRYGGRFLYLAVSNIIWLQGITRTTHELFDDIECCLIYRNRPLCNIDCKDKYDYNHRRGILIENTGSYAPLEGSSRCQ